VRIPGHARCPPLPFMGCGSAVDPHLQTRAIVDALPEGEREGVWERGEISLSCRPVLESLSIRQPAIWADAMRRG